MWIGGNTDIFSYILPTAGRIPDLHRLETCAAGCTTKVSAAQAADTSQIRICLFHSYFKKNMNNNFLTQLDISYT